MPFFSPKSLVFIIILMFAVIPSRSEHEFPAWDTFSDFKNDIARASLISNLPNLTEAGHYIGVQTSSSLFKSNSGQTQVVPSARMSVYPNPGYSLWAQLSQWPGAYPNFGVGVGLQVEFQADNPDKRQAIGVSWNEIHALGYAQRDVSVHGLYGHSFSKVNLGLIAIIDMHRVLVDKGIGFSSFDRTIYTAVPFVSYNFTKQFRTSTSFTTNSAGVGVSISVELFMGPR